MVQAILGTKSNLVGQGTAVSEPLGARQVAVMILGVVPICCRIPARSCLWARFQFLEWRADRCQRHPGPGQMYCISEWALVTRRG